MSIMSVSSFFFFFNDTATTEIYTLSLPTLFRSRVRGLRRGVLQPQPVHRPRRLPRSEEHTSELQSRSDLVCRLLLEKKKKITDDQRHLRRAYVERVHRHDPTVS